MNRLRIVCSCLVIQSMVVAGCGDSGGPKTSRVYGEVTFDGKPLDDGTIEFSAADGSHAAQGQIKGGKYDIPASAGPIVDRPYKVMILSLVKSGKARPSLMPGSSEAMEELTNIIPAQYNSQSTLSATVTGDKTQFDFKLDKGPAAKK